MRVFFCLASLSALDSNSIGVKADSSTTCLMGLSVNVSLGGFHLVIDVLSLV